MSSRETVFANFHKRTGLLPFGPDFHGALFAVMRDARSCLAERQFAWARLRAWCNSSEYAVSDWDPAKANVLDQIDCALDLAWLETGKPLVWIDGVPPEYRERARKIGAKERPKGVKDPAQMSRIFAQNEARGTVRFDGRKIIPIISPPEASVPNLTDRATFEQDSDFLEWWKLDEPDNFQKWMTARSVYFETRKLGRAARARYRVRASSEADIIIAVKALGNDVITTPTPRDPTAKAEASARAEEVVVVAKLGIPAKRARAFLIECRTAHPGCSIETIVAVMDIKIGEVSRSRSVLNKTAVVLTAVPERLLAAWQEQHGIPRGAGA